MQLATGTVELVDELLSARTARTGAWKRWGCGACEAPSSTSRGMAEVELAVSSRAPRVAVQVFILPLGLWRRVEEGNHARRFLSWATQLAGEPVGHLVPR